MIMVKNLRYNIANSLFRDKASLKAIALLLFFYHKHKKNVLKNWSVNKVANITGVHAYTIKKRINTLIQLKLAKIEGSSLVFLSVASETKFKAIRNNNTIPLNQAQISRITEKMMLAYHNKGKVTAWDFYNAATDMYKSATLDQPMIMSQNLAMVEFLNTHIL
jgi:hypothetical protein